MRALALLLFLVAVVGGTFLLTRRAPTATPLVGAGSDSEALDRSAAPELVGSQGAERTALDDARSTVDSRAATRGRVAPTDGEPLGEPVRVRLSWHSRADSLEDPRRVDSVDVASDGTFELRLPPDARRLTLDVDADFLALPVPLRLDVDALPDELVLAPLRGGCLRVDLVGPDAQSATEALGSGARLVARGVANGEEVRYDALLGRDGRPRFGGLPSDSAWRVQLTAAAYVDRNVAAPLVAPRTEATVAIDVATGIRVAGVVLGRGDAPCADARITARSWQQFDARILAGRQVAGRTDSEGRFELAGLHAGEVTLVVDADGHRRSTESLGRHPEGATLEGLVVRLDPGATLAGAVRWPDGRPAANAEVRVASEGASVAGGYGARTDDAGRFEARGLPDAPWSAAAWAEENGTLWQATLSPVAAGPVELVLERGESLAGQVVDDAGTPLPGAQVSAKPIGIRGGAKELEVRADESGAFELVGLRPGNWDLTPSAEDHATASSARIVVPDRPGSLVLVVPRMASLRGRVLDPSGQPLVGVFVEASRRKSETDADGAFALDGLPPGEVALQVAGAPFGPPAGPDPVLAPGEAREGHVVQLTAGGRIEGSVHPSYRTGTELKVAVHPHDSYSNVTALVDGAGRFEVMGLAAGTYRVSLDWTRTDDWVAAYRKRRAVLVDVAEGETTRVVLGAPDAYPITVHGVMRRDSEPEEGLLMYVFDQDAPQNQPLSVARSDADGRYEVDLPRLERVLFTVGVGQRQQAPFLRELSGEARQRLDFDVPAGKLAGRATLADGSPAGGRLLLLTLASGRPGSAQLGEVQFTSTQPDGTFEFPGLPPGEYRLRNGNYLRASSVEAVEVIEGIVVPEKGDAPPLELTLSPGASLVVTAVDRSGRPVSNRRVELFDARGWPAVVFDQRKTDYAGRITFTGLAAGQWEARVLDPRGELLGSARAELTTGSHGTLTVDCASR